MQTENRFFDDLARMMSGALSAAGGVREEAEARMRQHFEAMFARMDLVRREEFNVVRDMAALARQENERLGERIAELEAQLAAKPRRHGPKAAGPESGDAPAGGDDPDTSGH